VAALDRRVEILDETGRVAVLLAAVRRELDEVQLVRDCNGARQVGDEDRARLQRRDQDRILALVVAGDRRAELADACGDFRGGEVDLTDPGVGLQLASVSLYRWARRSMSRL
jgi:hypothetical protein